MRDGALAWVYRRMTRGSWSLVEIQFLITDRSSYARIFFLLALGSMGGGGIFTIHVIACVVALLPM